MSKYRTIDVEVNLDEFDDDDIVDYVVDAIKSTRFSEIFRDQLRAALNMSSTPQHMFNAETTSDKMKLELLIKKFDDYTYDELEQKLR